MLDSIINLSDEGVDRKLNVALTRAKEHLIILGTLEVIATKPIYARLIENCVVVNPADLYIYDKHY